jgi:signal peptidase I
MVAEKDMSKSGYPRRWLAVMLSLILPPMGMMYAGRGLWAGVYWLVVLIMAVISFGFMDQLPALMLQLLAVGVPVTAAFHVWFLVRQPPLSRPWFSRWQVLLLALLGLMTPMLLYRAFISESFTAMSDSMDPGLPPGQVIYADKRGCGNYRYWGMQFHQAEPTDDCQVQAGDVVVFQFPLDPSDSYVKRVVGMPGDHVQFIDNRLFINGEVVWLKVHQDQGRTTVYEELLGDRRYQVMYMNTDHFRNFKFTDVKVPEGHYFVLGDNRDNSFDSRHWGLVPADHLIGRVPGL